LEHGYNQCAVSTLPLPFVAFKVLEFHSQHVVLVVSQHVDVLIAKPELFGRVPKAVFVVSPVTVEVLSWFAEVVTSLDYLKYGKKIHNCTTGLPMLCSVAASDFS